MRYLVAHPLPPGMTRTDIEKVSSTLASNPDIKPYRSFLNLTEGKGVCVIDAPSQDLLAKWLRKNDLPYDSITPVELEGEHGTFIDVTAEAEVGTTP